MLRIALIEQPFPWMTIARIGNLKTSKTWQHGDSWPRYQSQETLARICIQLFLLSERYS